MRRIRSISIELRNSTRGPTVQQTEAELRSIVAKRQPWLKCPREQARAGARPGGRCRFQREGPGIDRSAGQRSWHVVRAWAGALLLWLGGCAGPQSALDPAGSGAERLADLFWAMLIGAAVIWFLVIGLAVYAVRLKDDPHHPVMGNALIVGGGVIFPTIVLAGLLTYGLILMPALRAPGDGLTIEVVGKQWWWEVIYRPPGGGPVVSANEVRLPVGRRVELVLSSPDVIHAFWIPALGGKLDMIPGRETRLVLEPTRTGTFRGQCAEYCGTSHALMAFAAVVMEEGDFEAWLAEQGRPAAQGRNAEAERGLEVFLADGCGACHTIRGTPAQGRIGPDLTHVGSRLTLGAGILANDVEAFARWIAHTQEVKPEAQMPSFGMLAERDLLALARYLESLK